jgi:hypothetical protein
MCYVPIPELPVPEPAEGPSGRKALRLAQGPGVTKVSREKK